MKKSFIIGIGLISGFIFELLNLSEFYSIFFPKNYVNANASLFLFIGPLLFIISSIIFTIFIKKYNWMWLMVGFFGGFSLCFMGFMMLLTLGGEV
ncbi:MAG: hypothetical protein A2639_01730 [Candidatus Staskawiczbacteria bacterium RIFCSPHIGHO2_01_FULL_34_27]|uniref:Uncharacterized protein n=2 Tax=Candidatus Staskawicziibacteriota TaxID=1817916 RepID=A0A1G2HLT2_9BACT|nr:MAG: hypothetical protein A2639_01730 [Candidatus Staskawiczbacteria bacterium RIFCSPHIGHO2_01_FULL_34_27]OGZ65852.1 MAG: hypothetical protein A3D34_03340 [Candidatus Staskawiczbacteria bacterium RIFCSPHIGHO2_02_FULL_33_16]OGZ70508.1 MAG: hypothetical protein A2980_00980 [Candidatus Staskawiczbacteria bacterium RIFCSPLOWO2_01_FULL_33_13]